MNINFDVSLKSLSGEEIREGENAIKLRDIVTNALLSDYKDESISGRDKFERGKLAEKIYGGGDLDLPIEDLSKIKELVGKYATPLVVLQVFNLIENGE